MLFEENPRTYLVDCFPLYFMLMMYRCITCAMCILIAVTSRCIGLVRCYKEIVVSSLSDCFRKLFDFYVISCNLFMEKILSFRYFKSVISIHHWSFVENKVYVCFCEEILIFIYIVFIFMTSFRNVFDILW